MNPWPGSAHPLAKWPINAPRAFVMATVSSAGANASGISNRSITRVSNSRALQIRATAGTKRNTCALWLGRKYVASLTSPISTPRHLWSATYLNQLLSPDLVPRKAILEPGCCVAPQRVSEPVAGSGYSDAHQRQNSESKSATSRSGSRGSINRRRTGLGSSPLIPPTTPKSDRKGSSRPSRARYAAQIARRACLARTSSTDAVSPFFMSSSRVRPSGPGSRTE